MENVIFLIKYLNYRFELSLKSDHQSMVSIIYYYFLPFNINLLFICLYILLQIHKQKKAHKYFLENKEKYVRTDLLKR